MLIKPTSTPIESITSAGLAVTDSKPAATNRHCQIMAAKLTCSCELDLVPSDSIVRQVHTLSCMGYEQLQHNATFGC